MGYIDCDGHVLENDETWSYLDPSERVYAPKTADIELNGRPAQFWIVADTWVRRFRSDGNFHDNANLYDPRATTLTDPAIRLADLDALGIDVQVIFSTFFISTELDHPLAEAALTRSFNRWMGERTADANGRLRWAVRPPLRTMERAFEELEYGAAHGAVGVHLRGVEHGYHLADPWLWPLYERAQDLGLAILVHLGTSLRREENLPVGQILPAPSYYMTHASPVLAGFHAVIASDLHLRFPRLKFGFMETGASWIPMIIHNHRRLKASGERFLQLDRLGPEELNQKNVFVACMATEDVGYLASVVGPGVLCAGTDYGHNDVGTELGSISVIAARPDAPEDVRRRIVDTNGRDLLGVDPQFTPAPGRSPDVDDIELPNVSSPVTDDGRPLLVAEVA